MSDSQHRRRRSLRSDLPRSTLGHCGSPARSRGPWPRRSARTSSTRIAAGEPPVCGVLGFEDTVIPQLENALLAGHDVILLGERGQAKTRIIRSLVELLDEWLPIVAGSEINDDPYAPGLAPRDRRRRRARRRDADRLGAPVRALRREAGDARHLDRRPHRRGRPDQGRRGALPLRRARPPYGLVPRVNRGIFAINELPDLAERIQVGLLNVLEERDIQIRGHRIRLPLDIVLVATANPEDYTNRGRIITPLKDRFGAQIRTHYPRRCSRPSSRSCGPRRPSPTVGSPDHRCRGSSGDVGRRDLASSLGAVPLREPAQRCLGAPHDRELRDAWWRTRCAARCAPARPRSCPA